MKLRARLALTLLVLVIPFAVALSFFQVWSRERAMAEAVADEIVERMELGGREECEASPDRWPPRPGPRVGRRGRGPRGPRGPRPPPGLRGGRAQAYDAAGRGAAGDRLSPGLLRELDAGAAYAVETIDDRRRPGRRIAVRMPWDEGPCAIVMVQRPAPPQEYVYTLGAPLAVSLLAVLIAMLAAGPAVRRTRRLTQLVRRSRTEDGPIDIGGADELAELARAFEASRREIRARMDELRQRDRALTEYIANTTHDVMLPLTVLQGHLSAMEARVTGGEPVPAALVADALEESHYMASLVRNLSAAAKLEAGAPHTVFHPVDLSALVERVIGRHATIAEQRGVSLEHAVPDEPVTVDGDVTLLEQAVSNVVHNAVRYNHEGGHVAVVLERDGDRFTLCVLDDGPGIDAAELSRLTERGFRSNAARTRQASGLGLGLSITRDVVERHGLSLRFESPEDGGLRVLIQGAARPA